MLVVARFEDEGAACRALDAARRRFPAADLHSREPLSERPDPPEASRVPHGALIGAVLGAAIAIGVQWWSAAVAYPLDIGGRTAPTFQSYLPPAIAIAMFWSALGATVAFLRGARLPRFHHPLFDAHAHARLSNGAILLVIEVDDGAAAEEAEAIARHAEADDIERVAG